MIGENSEEEEDPLLTPGGVTYKVDDEYDTDQGQQFDVEEDHPWLAQAVRDMHVLAASDAGLRAVVLFYVGTVVLNLGGLAYGYAYPQDLHSWQMVLVEVFLTLTLVLEVWYKYLHCLYVSKESFGHWEDIMDLSIALLSIVSTVLILQKAGRDNDDVDEGQIYIRILRDAARILRALLFVRTMVRMQVEFCYEDGDTCAPYRGPHHYKRNRHRYAGRDGRLPSSHDLLKEGGIIADSAPNSKETTPVFVDTTVTKEDPSPLTSPAKWPANATSPGEESPMFTPVRRLDRELHGDSETAPLPPLNLDVMDLTSPDLASERRSDDPGSTRSNQRDQEPVVL